MARSFFGFNTPHNQTLQASEDFGDNTVRGPVAAMLGIFVGDVVDDLRITAPEAAVRLSGLRDRAADLAVLYRNSYEIEQALRMETQQIQNRIKTLKLPRGDGGYGLGDDDARVRAEQNTLDLKTAELARRRKLSEVRGYEQQLLMRLNGNCETYLRSGKPGGTVIAAFAGELPPLKEGVDILGAVEDRRRRLRELAADRHRVECAPFPSAARKIAMIADVEAWAEQGRPNATSSVEHGEPISFPLEQVRLLVHNGGPGAVAIGQLADVRNFMAWWDAPGMIDRLSADIDAVADDATSMTDAQRAKARAAINADYLATERAECEFVWQAQKLGFPIQHREDIDVRALLGVDLVVSKAPPADNSDTHLVRHLGAPR